MIVVDVNVLVYRLVEMPATPLAIQAYEIDPEWFAPTLWSHEFANVMTTMSRQGIISLQAARTTYERAMKAMENRAQAVNLSEAIHLAHKLGLSAYDAQYVLLARDMSATLVTEDRKINTRAKETAQTLKQFCKNAA